MSANKQLKSQELSNVFPGLLTKIVSEIMAHFLRNIDFSQNLIFEDLWCLGVDVRKYLVRPWSEVRHPKGATLVIGAPHMTAYVPTRHQPMIKQVISSNQPGGGTQLSAAAGEGAALD